MRWAHALMSRLRSVFTRNRLERELDAELRFHLDQQIHENIAAGMSTAEAQFAAWRSMGGIAQVKEQCRDSLGVAWLDDLRRDLNYTMRALRRSPGFSAVAILTLAWGSARQQPFSASSMRSCSIRSLIRTAIGSLS